METNLAAMKRWTPGTAARVRSAEVPQGFQRVAGTDGAETYLRRHEGAAAESRRFEWLGGTSMPLATAVGVVAALDVGTGNGLGLGIGTGFEWKAFARRLASRQMVFAYEPDPQLVRMALTICDLSAELATGKVVILSGEPETAGEELATFLGEHLGFEVPGVLHALATVVGERRNALLTMGEAIVRRAASARERTLGALAERAAGAPRVGGQWVIEKARHGDRLKAELQTWHVAGDRFDELSAALRMRRVAEAGIPEGVVSDWFRGELGWLPEGMWVEAWLPSVIGAGYWERAPAAEMMRKGDRVVVRSGYHAGLLLERGYGQEQVQVRPLEMPERRERTGPNASVREKVAVFGELSGTDAKGLGIVLPTHQAVYTEANGIIASEWATVHDGQVGDILRRAIERARVSGETMADPVLGEPMRRIVRHVLVPTVPMMELLKLLTSIGLKVKAVGEWPEARLGIERAASGRNEEEWDALFNDVGVAVHFSPTGGVSPGLLEAAARGVPVLAVSHRTDAMPGAIQSLLPEIERVTPRQVAIAAKAKIRNA